MEWYEISNADTVDTPAVLVYRSRVEDNIRHCLQLVKSPDLLRPHVKTSKIAEVCQLMLGQGITRFKCATIAEAEMLGMIGAPDVLLAYQPVGPKVDRFIRLVRQFPGTQFSCLVDNFVSSLALSNAAAEAGVVLQVYIDINVGMNRTGILADRAFTFYLSLITLKSLRLVGLHVYDGHLHDPDQSVNGKHAGEKIISVIGLHDSIHDHSQKQLWLQLVVGGSVTFPFYREFDQYVCSPGTFVFWDWGYKSLMPYEPFDFSALVLTRVVSVISENKICIDLGHKSIASENPLPRVHFLNAPDVVPVSHSEEHMVLQIPEGWNYSVGDLLYGVPVHVCPTISMYEEVQVVDGNKVTGQWQVIARNKKITI